MALIIYKFDLIFRMWVSALFACYLLARVFEQKKKLAFFRTVANKVHFLLCFSIWWRQPTKKILNKYSNPLQNASVERTDEIFPADEVFLPPIVFAYFKSNIIL